MYHYPISIEHSAVRQVFILRKRNQIISPIRIFTVGAVSASFAGFWPPTPSTGSPCPILLLWAGAYSYYNLICRASLISLGSLPLHEQIELDWREKGDAGRVMEERREGKLQPGCKINMFFKRIFIFCEQIEE